MELCAIDIKNMEKLTATAINRATTLRESFQQFQDALREMQRNVPPNFKVDYRPDEAVADTM